MTEPLANDQIFIRKLTEIIHKNLENENFGVKELVQASCMSLYTLSRKLNRVNKKTINQFIREVRLQKAKEILQIEDFSVAEVAYKVGFRSPAYFNKCFHEYFGYPLGKIIRKKSNAWDDENRIGKISEERMGKNNLKKYVFTFPGLLLPVLIVIGLGFLVLPKTQRMEPNLPLKRTTIAVMPFQNMTSDTIWDVWQEGIQESLISWLSKKLDARIFIYGSIIKTETNILLDAQLIDTKTKEVLKSFEIKTPKKEELGFEIIDLLRRTVTNFLLISEMIKENPWLKLSQYVSTNSPEALKYYIYGYRAYYKADWATARNWFLKALSVDSNYIDAMSRVYYTYKNQDMMEQSIPWLIELEKCLEISRKRGKEYLKDNWAYPALGEMYHIAGQFKKEKRLYREADNLFFTYIQRFKVVAVYELPAIPNG
jgi:AraC-like DNA-binding protein/TolB-like protein